jgi:predicted HicB family RNase H-like nuclease
MGMKKKIRRKSPAGRHPLPEDQAKSRKVFFRAEPPFYAELESAAKQAGKPLATWIYDTLKAILGSK